MTDEPRDHDEVLDDLHEAGADPLFVAVYRHDPPSIRHSVRELVEKTEITKLPERGGHYATALWEGELVEAFYRADTNNSAILLDMFPRDYLVEAMVAEGYQRQTRENIIDERAEYVAGELY